MGWADAAQAPSNGGAMANVKNQFYGPAAPGYGNANTWHPTIAWLLAFTVGEMVLYHVLSHFLNI